MTLATSARSREHTLAGSTPELTVVVVPVSGSAALRRCLAALSRQRGAPTLEILVPVDDMVAEGRELASEFPSVRLLPLNGRHHPARLRAAALSWAEGRLVALTEDHCVPEAGWCAAIVSAHQSRRGVIGGAVDKTTPARALEWALYFCDYARFMPPVAAGDAAYASDCNVSYERETLDAVRPVWSDAFHETVVHDALRAAGIPLVLSPDVLVRQGRTMRLSHAIADRLAYGRLFASTRSRGLPGIRRMMFALGTALLPAVLTGRVITVVLGKRRHVGAMARALPAVLLLTTAWAVGELAGYLHPLMGAPSATPRGSAQPVEPSRAP